MFVYDTESDVTQPYMFVILTAITHDTGAHVR